MMHQGYGTSMGAAESVRGAPDHTISMLAYRSRAATVPTDKALGHLLRQAQERNQLEGLTGLLIYDQGHFFQWLEGPESSLIRVWNSIRRDVRHRDIEILREQGLPGRFFGEWDMRLARRTRGGIETALAGARAPDELLKRLRTRPTVLTDCAWDRIFADVVVPELGAKHAIDFSGRRISHADFRPFDIHPAAAIWHASQQAGPEFASALLAADGNESTLYVHGLIDAGAKIEPLFREVFEPAARCLGDLWEDGSCNDLNVTLAMGRLQLEVRRSSSLLMHDRPVIRPGHAILIAPQPGEHHGLAATMGSELFWRDGWDVSCEFPSSDSVLRRLVRDHWYDVLDLSLSNGIVREHDLQAMRVTIRAAQASSRNPALAILVEGRSFFERSDAYLDVGADIGCVTSTDAVLTAERLLDALASTKQPTVPPMAVSLNHYVQKLMTPELRQR